MKQAYYGDGKMHGQSPVVPLMNNPPTIEYTANAFLFQNQRCFHLNSVLLSFAFPKGKMF